MPARLVSRLFVGLVTLSVIQLGAAPPAEAGKPVVAQVKRGKQQATSRTWRKFGTGWIKSFGFSPTHQRAQAKRLVRVSTQIRSAVDDIAHSREGVARSTTAMRASGRDLARDAPAIAAVFDRALGVVALDGAVDASVRELRSGGGLRRIITVDRDPAGLGGALGSLDAQVVERSSLAERHVIKSIAINEKGAARGRVEIDLTYETDYQGVVSARYEVREYRTPFGLAEKPSPRARVKVTSGRYTPSERELARSPGQRTQFVETVTLETTVARLVPSRI